MCDVLDKVENKGEIKGKNQMALSSSIQFHSTGD